MIREFECHQVATFPLDAIGKCRQITTSYVVNHVLKDLRRTKAEESCGYFLSVTKLLSIGQAKLTTEFSSNILVLVPVKYIFRSFLPTSGETMVGTVTRVIRSGVFLSCGPMNCIYLHPTKMPGYNFVDSGEPCFRRGDDFSRVEKDVVVRFKVLAVRWSDGGMFKREFKILGTIEDDSLGPVSLAGDGQDFLYSYMS